MSLKRPTMMFTFFLLSVSILSGFAFQDFAYAETGMEVSVNADEGSTTISVSGHTSVKNNDITIMVQAPNGNIIAVYQVSPDANGDFMKDIQIGGSQWNQDGMYTVKVQQGSSTLYSFKLQAEVNGGITAATSVSDSTLELGIGEVSPIIGSTKDVSGLTITADVILGATSIPISGHTDRSNNDVTIVVTSPNGSIVSVDQVTPDANGDFMLEIQTASELWRQNGMYTISAQQGDNPNYKDSVEVEIVDGAVIPEFGTIAALILAVAIISIIAVSAKTRLSIIPKY
ncbi:MAG: PEFG-CTERM sorting domain-containing protein [Thaumarchaeota archaeon]|nr:PEFG-CTERM sorting domain-containing protein [Nitrososphaerota archaeon]